ncbi:MAG TPA: biotin--[acetyl-CoA-carboxylase] ligase, partial [Actinomycetota bacterium]|nr:biotin--[acetyl-CoA-carboxylase] ligase [Actinomycetota bacterium]
MLTEAALSRAVERAGLHVPVRFEEVTRSTQRTALELASAGAPEWTLVAAGHQTEGRGRLGRTWLDEPGHALMFSLVLRPALPAEGGGLLSLLAGVALVDACRAWAGGEAACKWPNDLLVDGRKAGGLLLEARLDDDRIEHAVLGVGVNLGAPPPDVPNAGAVTAEAEDLLAGFLNAFVAGYEPASERFARSVIADYRSRCATIGRRVRARTVSGATVDGV